MSWKTLTIPTSGLCTPSTLGQMVCAVASFNAAVPEAVMQARERERERERERFSGFTWGQTIAVIHEHRRDYIKLRQQVFSDVAVQLQGTGICCSRAGHRCTPSTSSHEFESLEAILNLSYLRKSSQAIDQENTNAVQFHVHIKLPHRSLGNCCDASQPQIDWSSELLYHVPKLPLPWRLHCS